MRTLRQLSMLAVGGVALYMASDGGNLEVFHARSSRARATLDERLMSTFGTGEKNFLRKGLSSIYDAFTATPKPKFKPDIDAYPATVHASSMPQGREETVDIGAVACCAIRAAGLD